MSTYPVQLLPVSYYDKLLTSEYYQATKFHLWLQAVLNIANDITTCLASITEAFDLDLAVGAQLDILGQIVGVGRILSFQPTDGSSPTLDDATYRILIRATIANNRWDGKIGSLYPLWDVIFPGGQILIVDNQNMTATIIITGNMTSIVQDLITHGLIVPRPQAVAYNYLFGTLPIFGFDIETNIISGFDVGNWV